MPFGFHGSVDETTRWSQMADVIEFVLEILIDWQFYLACLIVGGGAAAIYLLLQSCATAISLPVAIVYAVSMAAFLFTRDWFL
jgi:hypothetical protein